MSDQLKETHDEIKAAIGDGSSIDGDSLMRLCLFDLREPRTLSLFKMIVQRFKTLEGKRIVSIGWNVKTGSENPDGTVGDLVVKTE